MLLKGGSGEGVLVGDAIYFRGTVIRYVGVQSDPGPDYKNCTKEDCDDGASASVSVVSYPGLFLQLFLRNLEFC